MLLMRPNASAIAVAVGGGGHTGKAHTRSVVPIAATRQPASALPALPAAAHGGGGGGQKRAHTIATLRLLTRRLIAARHTHTRSSTTSSHRMPFSLRSDEELIAEAKRGLEALGVEVVFDEPSNAQQSAKRHPTDRSCSKSVMIATSRLLTDLVVGCAAVVLAPVSIASKAGIKMAALYRNSSHIDAGAAAAAWWRSLQRPEQEGGVITCCACHQRAPPGSLPPCQQCFASICTPCVERAGHLFKCPECSAWYLEPSLPQWGVPWDMPRPAPTRCQAATAAAPSTSSALPQHMAAAVGSDGWLRLPPQHQRMHPVDVLVDGVLAALDGCVVTCPFLEGTLSVSGDTVAFTRVPLSDGFEGKGVTLDSVRRDLKRVVDRLMREASAAPGQQINVQVSRSVSCIHPTADKPAMELALFTIRQRERGTSSGGGSSSGGGYGSSEEHDWELVQADPTFRKCWAAHEEWQIVQVAYLGAARIQMPGAVRRVLQDAHVRLGGAACGAKHVAFLCSGLPKHTHFRLTVDQSGRLVDVSGAPLQQRMAAHSLCSVLHLARTVEAPVHAACGDLDAVQQAGLQPGSGMALSVEAHVWRLAGLAWRHEQQRRKGKEGGVVRWERRGGAGRRGRRRREPGVVFELGPWGEQRRAVSHEEAAWVLAQPLRV